MKTLCRFAALALLGAAITWPVSAQTPRRVTVDDLMSLRTINDVKMSPAGDRVAYVVSTPSVARNAHEAELYVIPVTGGTAVRVAPEARIFVPALPAPRLRWSPDGDRLSFLGLVDGRPQVMTAPAAGGAARNLTAAAEGVNGYEISPDGKALAFLSRDASPPAPIANAVGALPPLTRLWVQSLAEPSTAKSLTPAGQYVDSFSWSPDGKEIAYAFAPVTGFLAPYSTRIFAVPAAGGTARPVVDRGGMNVSPQFSPDGRHVSFVTTNGRTGIISPRGLAVAPAAGGTAPTIKTYPMSGAWVAETLWARDSQSVLVTMNEGTFAAGAQMFEMPIVRVALDTGTATRVGSGASVQYSISQSRDGRTIAYREVEGRTMGDVAVLDVASGRSRQITSVNPELRSFALGDLKAISWRSFDGMEIWGLLLTPPGYDPPSPEASARQAGKTRIPLLVYCHGGPIGGVTLGIFPQFMHVPGQIDPYPTEAFASAGYAVLFPMPRGGSGYGEAGHKMIINDWGGPDYKDIMAGVDHVIARGVADPDRLGVMGASYGGFMTNWIVTQTGRFKAASAGASIADLSDLYYLTDGGDLMTEYFKLPWENPQGYAEHSPLTHAKNVTTPLLIQHGDRDPRVPLATAQKFYRALSALGKTVEMDIYPRGGHVFYEPIQERRVMQRNFDWMMRWIKP
jgi:dipeptidyl aminopeptidase/acylaminoacyl peptidase